MSATKMHGRRPAHLEMAGGKPPRQLMWEVIRQRRDRFSLLDVAYAAPADIETARTYLLSLERGGFTVKLAPDVYRLERDIGMEAPRLRLDGSPVTQGMGTTNMWRVIRMAKGDFDYFSLARDASTPEHVVSETTARSYIKALQQAGYLEMTAPARTKPGTHGGKFPCRWVLRPFNKITGLKPGVRAPMVQRLRTVYDPNWQQVVFKEEVSDD